jgi:hypothetical protein
MWIQIKKGYFSPKGVNEGARVFYFVQKISGVTPKTNPLEQHGSMAEGFMCDFLAGYAFNQHDRKEPEYEGIHGVGGGEGAHRQVQVGKEAV